MVNIFAKVVLQKEIMISGQGQITRTLYMINFWNIVKNIIIFLFQKWIVMKTQNRNLNICV